MFPSRYRLGVTATPRRADGLERVFFWHIGNIAAVGAKRRLAEDRDGQDERQAIRPGVQANEGFSRRIDDEQGAGLAGDV